ncbi:hypothetical protein RV02_GL000806 [Enterococcus gilvus]|nr:hypothetical protein RV02_GL000806 [Enterococcus gilvus]
MRLNFLSTIVFFQKSYRYPNEKTNPLLLKKINKISIGNSSYVKKQSLYRFIQPNPF